MVSFRRAGSVLLAATTLCILLAAQTVSASPFSQLPVVRQRAEGATIPGRVVGPVVEDAVDAEASMEPEASFEPELDPSSEPMLNDAVETPDMTRR
jgi:hypothetical protein